MTPWIFATTSWNRQGEYYYPLIVFEKPGLKRQLTHSGTYNLLSCRAKTWNQVWYLLNLHTTMCLQKQKLQSSKNSEELAGKESQILPSGNQSFPYPVC